MSTNICIIEEDNLIAQMEIIDLIEMVASTHNSAIDTRRFY